MSAGNSGTAAVTGGQATPSPLPTSAAGAPPGAYYRQKAAECQQLAESAFDAQVREQWLILAKDWIYLAERAERQPG